MVKIGGLAPPYFSRIDLWDAVRRRFYFLHGFSNHAIDGHHVIHFHPFSVRLHKFPSVGRNLNLAHGSDGSGGSSISEQAPSASHSRNWTNSQITWGRCLKSSKTNRKALEKLIGLLMWLTQIFPLMRIWVHYLYQDLYTTPATHFSVDAGDWPRLDTHLSDDLTFISRPRQSAIPLGSALLAVRHQPVTKKQDLQHLHLSTDKRIWLRLKDPGSSRRTIREDSFRVLKLFQSWISTLVPTRSLCPKPFWSGYAAADACASGDTTQLVVLFKVRRAENSGLRRNSHIQIFNFFHFHLIQRCRRVSLPSNLSPDWIGLACCIIFSRIPNPYLLEIIEWQYWSRISQQQDVHYHQTTVLLRWNLGHFGHQNRYWTWCISHSRWVQLHRWWSEPLVIHFRHSPWISTWITNSFSVVRFVDTMSQMHQISFRCSFTLRTSATHLICWKFNLTF